MLASLSVKPRWLRSEKVWKRSRGIGAVDAYVSADDDDKRCKPSASMRRAECKQGERTGLPDAELCIVSNVMGTCSSSRG